MHTRPSSPHQVMRDIEHTRPRPRLEPPCGNDVIKPEPYKDTHLYAIVSIIILEEKQSPKLITLTHSSLSGSHIEFLSLEAPLRGT